jgi:glycosyltransferase involved in cell wall biosynthesis
VTFLGYVAEEELPTLYGRCRAYILPGVEDFCIAPVEAQAAGRPVIAYGAGGALDTVIDGETGTFFHSQSAKALADAVRAFDAEVIDPAACMTNASRFDTCVFRQKLSRFIEEKLEE